MGSKSRTPFHTHCLEMADQKTNRQHAHIQQAGLPGSTSALVNATFLLICIPACTTLTPAACAAAAADAAQIDSPTGRGELEFNFDDLPNVNDLEVAALAAASAMQAIKELQRVSEEEVGLVGQGLLCMRRPSGSHTNNVSLTCARKFVLIA